MAAIHALMESAPSLVITFSGMPAAWAWRGRMLDTACVRATWEDSAGCTWYRVESQAGEEFLLGRHRDGWTAMRCDEGRLCSRSEELAYS